MLKIYSNRMSEEQFSFNLEEQKFTFTLDLSSSSRVTNGWLLRLWLLTLGLSLI